MSVIHHVAAPELTMQAWEEGPRKCILNLLDGAKEISMEEYTSAYTTIYGLCHVNQGNAMFDDIQEMFSSHLDEFVSSRLTANVMMDNEREFVDVLLREWEAYTFAVKQVGKLCTYLDRTYSATGTSGRPPRIQQASRELFISEVILRSTPPIKETLQRITGDSAGLIHTLGEVKAMLEKLSQDNESGELARVFPHVT